MLKLNVIVCALVVWCYEFIGLNVFFIIFLSVCTDFFVTINPINHSFFCPTQQKLLQQSKVTKSEMDSKVVRIASSDFMPPETPDEVWQDTLAYFHEIL